MPAQVGHTAQVLDDTFVGHAGIHSEPESEVLAERSYVEPAHQIVDQRHDILEQAQSLEAAAPGRDRRPGDVAGHWDLVEHPQLDPAKPQMGAEPKPEEASEPPEAAARQEPNKERKPLLCLSALARSLQHCPYTSYAHRITPGENMHESSRRKALP
jgi:hypothetical protein